MNTSKVIAVVGACMALSAMAIVIIELLLSCVWEIQDYFNPNYDWPYHMYTDIDLVGPIVMILFVVGALLAAIFGGWHPDWEAEG